MNAPGRLLSVVADIVRRYDLVTLGSLLRACEALSGGEPIDLAVLGQFKSGKSSLLNALLGQAVFPVGVVPVTAVITRASASPEWAVQVLYLNGGKECVPLARLGEFVTEADNPGNRRQVAVVDVFTPSLSDLAGVRLVDTPGLGSVRTHTEATRKWMPHVAVALVTVSAERPLSDEDRRLIAEARQTAPRVSVVLTKVDLLTADELREVTAFLNQALHETFQAEIPVIPFSSRVEPERWVGQLREAVLVPVSGDVAGEREAVLALKLANLVEACRGYLMVGLEAAQRVEADRDLLRAAVLDESVNAALIGDELRLGSQSVRADARRKFEQFFLASQPVLQQRIRSALADELGQWHGNLAAQARRYEDWMAEHLRAELQPLSETAAPMAAEILVHAETRLRRVLEGFRDRLQRNIRQATGVTISPVSWEVKRPTLAVVPVCLSQTFATNWDLLWWLLPMKLIGWLFRRHVLGRVAWEVEKNLHRLAGDWAGVVDAAIDALQSQASTWVSGELATLRRLLGQHPTQAIAFREALERLQP